MPGTNGSTLYAKAKVLVPGIKQVMSLAKEFHSARNDFNKRFPTPEGELPSWENYEAYHADPEVQRTKGNFFTYLNNLSYDDVVIIQAIMYVGRDEKDPEEYERTKQDVLESGGDFYDQEDGVYDSPQKKIFDFMKIIKGDNFNTKEISISTMLSKTPLIEYLNRGIKILQLESQ